MRILRALMSMAAVSITLFLITLTVPALAADPIADACQQGTASSSSICTGTTNTDPLLGPTGIITNVIQLITIAIGVAAVVMIIIGGFKYIVSSGDPSNIESAKNTILFAVIGLVIALLAQAVVIFVLRRF